MPPNSSPTHFLCIPLAGAQLATTLASFRADVTSAMSFGLPEEAVRPLGTLHLTLGVMSLKPDTVGKAVELLRGLRARDMLAEARIAAAGQTLSRVGAGSEPVGSNTNKLSITIRGLHSMQPAAKAAVLYAPPADPQGILYDFCKRLRKPFQDAGLMADDNRPLLLHATLFNTVYVKNRGRGKGRDRLTVDARDVLSRYDDYIWAEDLPITRVALCRMGAKQIAGTDDAAYEMEAELRF
ncbi:hypothetical protein PT974_10130 [Cladobotryum mycophilum]|uniref:A-kinase anchor protein 7-like phosphoesterase domain-containing protein n=1 Tax=Cladobotryum mycophilum TaxID=491253 RepID=A0ABR0S8Z8_9HYPO